MAQLIKLKDYISRYEWNAFRYPSQFIQFKQEKWEKAHRMWLEKQTMDQVEEQLFPENRSDIFSKIKSFFTRTDESVDTIETESPLPTTEQELRQYFLDELYPFQLKWATSTVTDISFIDETYYNNRTLIYFLQRFPDIYLIMFEPVFNIKDTPIDGEMIMISPLGIEIVYLLEDHPSITYLVSDERTWTVETANSQQKILSPLIALRRTEQIVQSSVNKEKVNFPTVKTILSRTNDIIITTEPYQTKIIGKREYEQWFNLKRRLSSPLKSDQLRAADALLKYCMTTAIRRPEWEIEADNEVSEEL